MADIALKSFSFGVDSLIRPKTSTPSGTRMVSWNPFYIVGDEIKRKHCDRI